MERICSQSPDGGQILINPVERQFARPNILANRAFRLFRRAGVHRKALVDRQNDRP